MITIYLVQTRWLVLVIINVNKKVIACLWVSLYLKTVTWTKQTRHVPWRYCNSPHQIVIQNLNFISKPCSKSLDKEFIEVVNSCILTKWAAEAGQIFMVSSHERAYETKKRYEYFVLCGVYFCNKHTPPSPRGEGGA